MKAKRNILNSQLNKQLQPLTKKDIDWAKKSIEEYEKKYCQIKNPVMNRVKSHDKSN